MSSSQARNEQDVPFYAWAAQRHILYCHKYLLKGLVAGLKPYPQEW